MAGGGGAGKAFDENVAGGLATERNFPLVGQGDGEKIGHGVAPGEAQVAARAQAGIVDEAEEFRVLAGNAGDARGYAGGQLRKRKGMRGGHAPGSGRDGIAMGINTRVAEEGIEAFDEAVGPGMLEELGFLMDFRPIEAEGVDEEHLDEAVFAEHLQGELLARGGEAGADARGMLEQARLGQSLNHRGGRAGDDMHGACEVTHGHQTVRMILTQQVELFDVVFDRAGGHGVGRGQDFEASK